MQFFLDFRKICERWMCTTMKLSLLGSVPEIFMDDCTWHMLEYCPFVLHLAAFTARLALKAIIHSVCVG